MLILMCKCVMGLLIVGIKKPRVWKTRGPGKPVHFAKPETWVYDDLKPGFRVCVFRTFSG